MPEIFPLNLFPTGALDSSVITTVWVGVMVVAFFNLRFGWVLSGLVVPGYLVPLLLVKPLAAGVTIFEGVLTYGLVWLYSEYLSRRGGWSNLFGRDRFFALVVVSVAVRLVADGWLLPLLSRHLVERYGLRYDLDNNLYSFGLIIVALIANGFWKPGLRAGLLQLATTVGLTLAIVRFGLMEYTNFSIGNLGYMYEDFATSILGSPKSYIILLSTAFLASRMNLYYGWDFSGILIPSLLALQWYEPRRILTSFLEAGVVLVLASLVLRAPPFRRTTVEGARKIALFFNLSFAYKLALGHVMAFAAPGAAAADWFGFGYLLPTLLAVKMHDKEIPMRMTRATLQTSLVAVAGASAVGFLLTLLPPIHWGAAGRAAAPGTQPLPLPRQASLGDVVGADKLAMYAQRLAGTTRAPSAAELSIFREALALLRAHLSDPSRALLARAAHLLQQVDYTLVEVGPHLCLIEDLPRRGWGGYVLNTAAQGPLALEAPLPLNETGTLEAALGAYLRLGARALSFGGTARKAGGDSAGDVLANRYLFFQAFHETFGREGALQLRDAGALPRATADAVSLRVKGSLPDGLDLPLLRTLTGPFGVSWEPLPTRNAQRAASDGGFAELYADRSTLRRLQARAGADADRPRDREEDRRIDGYLQDWLLGSGTEIAPAGSEAYVMPATEQLLYMDEEVVTPLLSALATGYADGDWTPDALETLREINRAAQALGYEVILYREKRSRADFAILAERVNGRSAPRRYWGTYVFRAGPGAAYMVQAPRPLLEVNSFEFAVSLYAGLDARFLLIAGTHPAANADGSADLVRTRNRTSLFNLVNQVVLREAGEAPLMIVQSRALSPRPELPMPDSDILLATDPGAGAPALVEPLEGRLLETLAADGFSLERVAGAPAHIGYEVGGVPQAQYLQSTRGKRFAIAWVSPAARRAYRQQADNALLGQQFAALGIPTTTQALADYLEAQPFGAPPPAALVARLRAYARNQDVVALRALQLEWPGLVLERIIDANSRQAFIVVRDPRGGPLALANVAPRDADLAVDFGDDAGMPAALERFIGARAALLLRRSP